MLLLLLASGAADCGWGCVVFLAFAFVGLDSAQAVSSVLDAYYARACMINALCARRHRHSIAACSTCVQAFSIERGKWCQ